MASLGVSPPRRQRGWLGFSLSSALVLKPRCTRCAAIAKQIGRHFRPFLRLLRCFLLQNVHPVAGSGSLRRRSWLARRLAFEGVGSIRLSCRAWATRLHRGQSPGMVRAAPCSRRHLYQACASGGNTPHYRCDGAAQKLDRLLWDRSAGRALHRGTTAHHVTIPFITCVFAVNAVGGTRKGSGDSAAQCLDAPAAASMQRLVAMPVPTMGKQSRASKDDGIQAIWIFDSLQ